LTITFLKEDQLEIIQTLAKHEEAISRLYEEYAQKFPQEHLLWSALAGDEIEHSMWVKILLGKIEEGLVHFNEGRFKIGVIRGSLNYIREEIARARDQEMPLPKALSIALNIEKSMIEKGYFQVFEGDSADLREALNNLAAATEEHCKEIEKVWAKYGGLTH
jgi:hypothetical protein